MSIVSSLALNRATTPSAVFVELDITHPSWLLATRARGLSRRLSLHPANPARLLFRVRSRGDHDGSRAHSHQRPPSVPHPRRPGRGNELGSTRDLGWASFQHPGELPRLQRPA